MTESPSTELPNPQSCHSTPARIGLSRKEWKCESLQIVALVLTVVLLYFPALSFDFLNWDDYWYLHRNELIWSWHPANLWKVATEFVARNYAPATIFTFLVEHTLWGMNPAGYHATNILLHALNTALVFHLLRQLTRNDWLSFSVALLFAVHPVQVESVAWISSRKTLLSSTFMLASFICWLRPERTARQEAWGILWLLLGLLAKASCVVIPAIVIAYDVLVARRKVSDALSRQFIPIFFCLILILSTMQAQVTIVGGVRGHIGMSKLQLFAVNLTLLWRYVFMLIWPTGLCVLYDPPTNGIGPLVFLSAVGWGLVTAVLWRIRKTQPLVTFAGISALLIMIPMLNLFPLTTLMNDRYLYLTCIPVFAIFAAMLRQGWQFLPRLSSNRVLTRVAACTVTFAVAGALSVATHHYLPVWRDPISLWNDARSKTPSLTVVHVQWALALEELGERHEAIDALDHAMQHCHPDEADQKRIEELKSRLLNPESRPMIDRRRTNL